ncbi:unnamed protein product [Durusdinium trenchii]|uniref:Uncharacterized protein n=1 Tax=Durusdinium trenchii TaxID=1381693 RepID=A0ABP0NDP5_9DINO
MSVVNAVNRAQKKARGAPPMLPGGMTPMPQMVWWDDASADVGEGDTYTSEDEQASVSSTVPPKAAGIPLRQESSAVPAEDGVQHHQRLPDALISRSVVNKFSLVLTDENIRAIACDLGWQDEWLITNRKVKGRCATMKLGKPSSVVTPFIDYASLSGAFVRTRVHKTVHFAVARMLPRVLAMCAVAVGEEENPDEETEAAAVVNPEDIQAAQEEIAANVFHWVMTV